MWAIVNPLVPALLFTFVFTRVVKMETPKESYVVLVTAAMVPWNAVSRALGRGGGSLVAERQLLTKVYLPRLLVPLAQVAGVIVDLLVSLLIRAYCFGGQRSFAVAEARRGAVAHRVDHGACHGCNGRIGRPHRAQTEI